MSLVNMIIIPRMVWTTSSSHHLGHFCHCVFVTVYVTAYLGEKQLLVLNLNSVISNVVNNSYFMLSVPNLQAFSLKELNIWTPIAFNTSHGILQSTKHDFSAILCTFIIRRVTEILNWELQLKPGGACSEKV